MSVIDGRWKHDYDTPTCTNDSERLRLHHFARMIKQKMALPLATDKLLEHFDNPSADAVVLLGSHARGDAGPQSDIDLLRLAHGPLEDNLDGSHLLEQHLVVVSSITYAEAESWFTRPEQAVNVMRNLRLAVALRTRSRHFQEIQARAHAFTWTPALQEAANLYAGDALVGWIEEVHKGLEGLQRNDPGRLLQARFGLSFGLNQVVHVQRGILTWGDNDLLATSSEELGAAADWVSARAATFGLTGAGGSTPTLQESVRAGLRLYQLTAQMMLDSLAPAHARLVNATVERITLFFTQAVFDPRM